jgi:amino acid adenylation domain-containing protein
MTSSDEAAAFFTQMLGDVDELTAPFDRTHARGGDDRVEARRQIGPTLARRLRERAAALGVTTDSLHHLAWAKVLSVLARRDDVVFGTSVAGHTLPIRLAIGDDGVAHSARETHARLTALGRHAGASLELAQRCSARPAPARLFVAHLDCESARGGEAEPARTARDPFALAVADRGDDVELTVWVERALDATRICDYMQRALEALVEALAQAPDTPASALDILPAAERHQLLVAWNQTEAAYPDACLHQLIEAQVTRTPAAVAVAYGRATLSYAELDARANRLAHHLRTLGVKPDSRVALCVERSLEMVIGVLAVLKAGGAYVPLDPAHPVERLLYMLADSAPAVLLTHGGLASAPRARLQAWMAERGGAMLDLAGDAERWRRAPDRAPDPDAVQLQPHHLAYVIYTSGSTGTPKGVMVEHRSVVNYLWWAVQAYAVRGRALMSMPLSFDGSVTSYQPLLHGGCVQLFEDRDETDGVLRTLQGAATPGLVKITPSHLSALMQREGAFARPVETLIVGGEAFPPALVRRCVEDRVCAHLVNEYGPTETTCASTSYPIIDPDACAERVPLGRPVANTQLYVLNERQAPVPIGVVGELYIGGVGVARGYLGLPELTAERFLRDPFRDEPGARMYRTGDLARYRADGNLEYCGRNDHQVKVRGYRIELGEIEAALTRLTGICETAVVVHEARPGDRRLVAYYVEQGGLSEPELRAHLGRALPAYMMPQRFVRLERMPVTQRGKIDRAALPPPPGTRPDVGVDFVEPATPTERILAGVLADVLGIDQVGATDDFFLLGGTSLLAMQAARLLEHHHQRRVPAPTFFEYPRTADLARWLDDQRGAPPSAAVADPQPASQPSERAERAGSPIAIVGMAGRFPGARDVDELWQNLVAGRASITRFSDADLDPDIAAATRRDPRYVPARGIVDGADLLDAAFFGIPPAEARIMDPQQRIFLETSWAALEHAGYAPESYPGRIGVFGGVHQNTYYAHEVLARPDLVDQIGAVQVSIANDKDYVATRAAYKLDLTGPAISVQTSCSTSLVAVCQAVQSLRAGGCEMAIAGAVSITVPVRSGHIYQPGAMLSRDGSCRPFDAEATGTTFSDGAALVVLKRLDDAVADGDTIYAVIRGVGVNNDGGRRASFTAPSVDGQAAAIASALADSGVSARSISYVEAHGTATPLGDPIEVAALTRAFRATTKDNGFCAIGSVKSNLGHLAAAAGTAGLIKAAWSLFHRRLAPSVHFTQPNPHIDFANSPFFVQQTTAAWHGERPLRAGVSSFGVGGTNAHVVVEEAPPWQGQPGSRPAHLVVVSARSPSALEAAKHQLAGHLRDHPELDVADAAYTLQRGRRGFRHRAMIVAKDREDAVAQLTAPGVATRVAPRVAARLAFMFPGQGAQHAGMGAGLYRTEPVFRDAVDLCARTIDPLLGHDLRGVMFARAGDADERLRETRFAQPALFVIAYALAALWRSWEVVPDAMIGHSVGEFVCAALAGVMGLEDALRLVVERGRLLQSLPPGGMLAVRLAADQVRPRLRHPGLAIAAVNAPMLCVVAGPSGPLGELERALAGEGVACRALHTSHAFHSPMMDPAVEPFAELVAKVALAAPRTPFVSSVTGRWIEPDQATSPMYWARHLRDSMLFGDGVRTLWQTPGRVLLEVGPRTTLAGLARQQITDRAAQRAISSLAETADGDADYAAVLHATGQLWLAGIAPAWLALHGGQRRRRIALPTYPFERQRFWIERPPGQGEPAMTRVAALTPAPPTPAAARLGPIKTTLRQLFEDTSGIAIGDGDDHTSFIELGLDSLFLNQIALTIEKRFGVETTLWQLLDEHRNLEALARRLHAEMPAESAPPAEPAPPVPASVPQVVPRPEPVAPAALRSVEPAPVIAPVWPVAVPAVVPAAPAVVPAAQAVVPAAPAWGPGPAPGVVQYVLDQQLRVMSQQLALLGAAPPPAALPALAPPAPAPSPAPALAPAPAPEPTRLDPPRELHDAKKPFGAAPRITLTSSGPLTPRQQGGLDALTRRYTARTQQSKRYSDDHRGALSDPRLVTGFRPMTKEVVYPIVVERSRGSRLWDLDGNEYVDVLCGYGSNFFGWSPPFIVDAIRDQLERGIELGTMNPLAADVARLVCEITGFERAAFCNTGSEAVLGAIRLARTVTGRRLIASFNVSYHGIYDEMIVRGGKHGRAIPAAPGIMPSTADNILVLDYGTPEALEILRARASELAAILVEPVQSRRPDLQPRDFIHELRNITTASGTALIFDEVITGFRVAPGGAQEYFGVRGDIAAYGKIVGGGMPIGVVAGQRRFMDAFDGGAWRFGDDSRPTATVTYIAGTFIRHPLSLAAAKASLLHLQERGPELHRACNARTDRFAAELNAFFAEADVPIEIRNFGSLWKTFYLQGHPFGDLLFVYLRDRGVHIWEPFPCFLGEAHTDADVDFIVRAFKDSVREMQDAGFLPEPAQRAATAR